MTVLGCSPLSRDDLVEAYADSRPEATEEEAGCVVDGLLREYSTNEIEAQLDDGAPSDDFEWRQFSSEISCGLTSGLEARLSDQLVETGVDPDAAPCVAATLAGVLDDADLEVLRGGPMTDTFYAKYFDALDACEALP